MNLNELMGDYVKGYMEDIHDMISEDDVGGFEKIQRNPDKKVRGDSKRIGKKERERIKKQRKHEKDMERVLGVEDHTFDNDWQMV